MAFADVAANLRLNISNFSAGITAASKQMGTFAKNMNKQYGDASKALTNHNFGLKDTSRIVQGIMVAQTFYTGARAIREATNALWDFNKSLDYAHITYSALFGDTKLASNFMNVLQEHSIKTIFDYQDLADASKKLLAYGIEYKNLMFIMEGLTNLGAMSGDTAALDRISLALGQIYTRGKLTAEEMRQLANAYVPISEIVQEKFNLTPDEMGQVGKLNLPAGEVINAIVDYANERFASVGDAAMYTITGLQNKIVDTLKVMGTEMLTPITNAYKSFLAYVANGLEAIRDEFATGGIGGVFEYLVPDPNTQQMIRQFVANVRNLFMSLASAGVVAGQVFGNFAHVLVSAFNIVSPVIVTFTNVLAAALNGMLSTRTGATLLRIALLGAAAAFVVMRVHAAGALIVTAVTKAVMGLSRALLILASLVTKHPILALLAGLAIALVGVSTASNNANSGLNKLFDTISGAGGGSSSGDVLQNVEKDITDSTDAIEDFNDRFEDGASAAEDMADGIDGVGSAADKARKKAGLLSFDEVFKLNEPTDSSGAGSGAGAGAGIGDDIENLIDGLGGLGDALIPDIPDFSDFVDDFTDGLFGGLRDGLLTKLASLGIGAYLAGKIAESLRKMPLAGVTSAARNVAFMVMRAISGALLGLGIDAVASQFTQKLWQVLEDKFNLMDGSAEQAKLGATIGSAIGGAIGMVVGGLPGSLIGTAIGHLAGGIVGLLWEEIGGALSNSVTGLLSGLAAPIAKALATLPLSIGSGTFSGLISSIGTAISSAGAKAIAKGGIIGLAIGFITDGIAALLWNTLAEKFNLGEGAKDTAKVGQTIGSVIGTVIGGILGGPPGALIGSAIGTFAGGIVGLFWDKIAELLANPNVSLGAAVGASVGAFFGPVGAAIGAVVGGVIGNFWEEISAGFTAWWADLSQGFGEWWAGITADWDAWCDETAKALTLWWEDVESDWQRMWSSISNGFSTWWETTKTNWSTKYNEIKTDLNTWWDGVKSSFATKQQEILTSLSTWWSTTKTNWATKYAEIKTDVSTWWTNVKTNYSTKQDEIMRSLSTWLANTKSSWSTKYAEIKSNISTWWSNLKRDLGANFGEMLTTTATKLTGIKTEWSNKWNSIKTEFGTWWKNLKTSMGKWLEDYVWKPIADFFNIDTFWGRIKGLLNTIKSKVSSWWSGVKSLFSTDVDVNANVNVNSSRTGSISSAGMAGHAAGGIFNREHIARFAEGDKAEAIIPLENPGAMQPFVNAVADGLVGSLAPLIASSGGNRSDQLPPMYVGTLIADERGLKQLYKKFELIQVQENARRGMA